jgi:hypothetical protein
MGMNMRKLLIGLALSVMASATQAQAQWVLVQQAKGGDKFYADPTTKRRTNNVVRVWELSDYLQPVSVSGKLIYSQRSYLQYDCAERTYEILQLNSFLGPMASGVSLPTVKGLGNDKTFVSPGSVREATLNFSCK